MLLLERAARPGFWQSVTGSLDRPDEPYAEAAVREVREETGIDAAAGRLERWPVAYTFEIYSQWRHRFAPGVTHNTERLFSLALPARQAVELKPGGYHLMLMDLKQPLAKGTQLPLTLRFVDASGVASQREVQVPVGVPDGAAVPAGCHVH